MQTPTANRLESRLGGLTSPTTEVVGFCGHRPHPRRWEFRTRSSVVRCHRQRRERALHGSVLGGASTAPVPDSGILRPCPELDNTRFTFPDNQAYTLQPTSLLVGFRAVPAVTLEGRPHQLSVWVIFGLRLIHGLGHAVGRLGQARRRVQQFRGGAPSHKSCGTEGPADHPNGPAAREERARASDQSEA